MRKFFKLSRFGVIFLILMLMPMVASGQNPRVAAGSVELPKLIANPADGSRLTWFTGIAMRWGTSRLTLVDKEGFKVTHNGKDITRDGKFDFIMQLVEYDPDDETSWEDVQLQIESTGIFPMMDEGTYEFTVYEGAVTVNVDGIRVPNPEVLLTYYIGNATPSVKIPDPTVTPSNNSTLEELETVALSWNGYYVHQIGDGEGGAAREITYTVDGGDPVAVKAQYQGNESMAFEGYYPTLVLPIHAEESGKYVITIPSGTLYVANGNNGSLLVDKEIVLTYNVALPVPTPPSVLMTGAGVDPRDGAHLDNIGNITITWSRYTLDIQPAPGKDYVDLPLDGVHIYINGEENDTWINGMGASLRAINTQGSNEAGGGAATEFKVAEVLLSPGDLAFWWNGTVNIVLPEGLVKATDGSISPEFNLTYHVGGMDAVSPAVFTPEEGATLQQGEAVVYVAWDGYNVSAVNGNVTVNGFDEEGELSGRMTIGGDNLSIENGRLMINLVSLPAGNYQLWIGQGTVSLGGNAVNADAFYSFSIQSTSGVESMDEDECLRVYDLNGVNLLNTVNAADLRRLSSGIYVVNGAKVLVR